MTSKRRYLITGACLIGLALVSVYLSGQVWQDPLEMYSLTLDYMFRLLRYLTVLGGCFLLCLLTDALRHKAWVFFQAALMGVALWRSVVAVLLPFKLFSPDIALEMNKDLYVFSLVHLLIFILFTALGLWGIRRAPRTKWKDKEGVFRRLSPVLLVMGITGLLVFLGNETTLPTAFIANLLLSLCLVYLLGTALWQMWLWGSQLLPQFLAKEKKEPQELKASPGEKKPRLSFQSLYSIRLVRVLAPWMLLVILVCLFVSSALYTVQPHERALLYRFGVLQADQGNTPGLHFKYPWPVDQVRIIDTQRVRKLSIGYTPSGNGDFLWTSRHGGEETAFLLGGGNELAAINIRIHYHISHAEEYAHHYDAPEEYLAAKAHQLLMEHTSGTDLNRLLSIDRKDFSEKLLSSLTGYSEALRLGLKVDTVVVESLHPPVDVADVYQDVINAGLRKTAMVTQAQGEAAAAIHVAQSQREAAIQEALAKSAREISNAKKQHLGVLAAMEGAQNQPDSLRLMRWIKTYQNLLNWERVYVFSPRALLHKDRFVMPMGTGPVLIQPNQERK